MSTSNRETLKEQAMRALNVCAKWRSVLTGWQLGTRPKGDPESEAIRDQREVLILLRIEVSNLITLLLTKGIIAEEDFLGGLIIEASFLNEAYAKRFPGYTATEVGMAIDSEVAAETNKKYHFNR